MVWKEASQDARDDPSTTDGTFEGTDDVKDHDRNGRSNDKAAHQGQDH